MLKMIKMDLYRFFHSMSIWITLFADIVLAGFEHYTGLYYG